MGAKTEVKALKVTNGKLTDLNGSVVQLRGISTSGLQWYPEYINQETFAFFKKEMNINVMRLALYTAEEGYCEVDDAGKKAFDEVIERGVDAAEALGLYVLVDWHILSDGNPNQTKAEAIKFFDKMSQKFAGKNHVIYEICNEPNGNLGWEDIKSYAMEVIPVIRKNAPDSVILVGTPTWSQEVDKPQNDPLPFENLMYVLHFYAATHKDNLRTTLKEALDHKLPVFVSEFGITDASGNGEVNEEEANKWISLMDAYDVSYIIWNLSNRDEASALLVKDCKKTTNFTDDDYNQQTKWFKKMMN